SVSPLLRVMPPAPAMVTLPGPLLAMNGFVPAKITPKPAGPTFSARVFVFQSLRFAPLSVNGPASFVNVYAPLPASTLKLMMVVVPGVGVLGDQGPADQTELVPVAGCVQEKVWALAVAVASNSATSAVAKCEPNAERTAERQLKRVARVSMGVKPR